MTFQVNKFMKMFVETKMGEEAPVDKDVSPFDLIKKSKNDDKLYKFKNNVFCCLYKTILDEAPAVMMVFVISNPKLKGRKTPASSTTVRELMENIEELFFPVDYTEYIEDNVNYDEDLESLKIIKKVKEDDYI